MKKIYVLGLTLLLLITVSGCGKKTSTKEEKTEFSLGEKIEIRNFELEFLNYSIRKAVDAKEKYQNLVFLEVNLTNTSNKTQHFATSAFKAFGPNNLELKTISTSKYTSSLNNLGNIRSKGTTNGHIIFNFSGYGEYYLEFTNKNKNKVTLIFNIDEPKEEY